MKKLIALFLVVIMVISLCACGKKLSAGDLIGIWSGAWEYEGHRINTAIQFERDGTYAQITFRDNTVSSVEEGIYTIDGNEVNCKQNGPFGTTTYKFSGGKLTNNGHSLSKE